MDSDPLALPNDNVITPRFHDRLRLELAGRGKWILASEFRFDSAVLRARIIVDAGFPTDLASVPRIPFAYLIAGGYADAEAVLHDWAHKFKLFPRVMADALFLEAMGTDGTDLGVPRMAEWRRQLMWRAVSLATMVRGQEYSSNLRALTRRPK